MMLTAEKPQLEIRILYYIEILDIGYRQILDTRNVDPQRIKPVGSIAGS